MSRENGAEMVKGKNLGRGIAQKIRKRGQKRGEGTSNGKRENLLKVVQKMK